MFYFLQPIWMFAAAGIIIPIAVHLWNVRQGKILKIGSVSLLTEQAIKNTSSIKLHDLLLLLLRCLLIILLAALLAKPQWLPTNANKEKGWVLIPREGFRPTYTYFKPKVDSLLQAGYALHYFDAGFEETEIDDALRGQGDSIHTNAVSYWRTISQLNILVDTTMPLYIFTGNRLADFIGSRPGTSLNMQWYTYNNDDSSYESLVEAYKTYNDSLRIVTANSKSSGTFNTYNDISASALSSKGYTTQSSNNHVLLNHKNDPPVVMDTANINITIYAGSYPNDAGYVKAAVDAVRQFSKRNIKLVVAGNAANIPAGQDWVFWLSDKPRPANISAKNIFQYETGKEISVQTWLTPDDAYSMGNSEMGLYKCSAVGQNMAGPAKTLWQDGFGSPVLREEEGNTNIYRFRSRFNPSWNGLPWSNDFPQLMLKLLICGNNHAIARDNRMIDTGQLQPYANKETGNISKITKVSIDVSNIFWLFAAIIFFMERIVAHRGRKEGLNAAQ